MVENGIGGVEKLMYGRFCEYFKNREVIGSLEF